MPNLQVLLIIFIAVTAIAVLIQACVLIGMAVAMKKTTARMEALAKQLETRALPLMDTTQSMLAEYRPKLDLLISNVTETTTTVKRDLDRVQPALEDLAMRAHLQALRVDDLMTTTLDRVSGASDAVSQSVTRPLRQATGVIFAVATGIATLFGRGNYARARKPSATPKDDWFI
jgi:hypothetical protein